jgi:hypothetical protein
VKYPPDSPSLALLGAFACPKPPRSLWFEACFSLLASHEGSPPPGKKARTMANGHKRTTPSISLYIYFPIGNPLTLGLMWMDCNSRYGFLFNYILHANTYRSSLVTDATSKGCSPFKTFLPLNGSQSCLFPFKGPGVTFCPAFSFLRISIVPSAVRSS